MHSQSTRIDSLLPRDQTDYKQSLLSVGNNDTAKAKIFGSMFWLIVFFNPDSALLISQQELIISRKYKLLHLEYDALSHIGYAQFQMGHYPEALKYEFEALAVAEALKNPVLKGEMHGGIGEIYRDEGDLTNSLYHLNIWKKMIDPNDTAIWLEWYSHAAPVYERLNVLDSALDFAWKSIDLDVKFNGAMTLTVTVFYIGNIYFKLCKYDSALKYYHLAIKHSKEYNIKKDLVEIYNSMARLYIKQGVYDSSIRYANLALDTEKEFGFPLGKLESARILGELFRKMNRPDSVIKYLQLSIATQDSMFSQEKLRQFANLGFREQLLNEQEQTKREQLISRYRMYALIAALVVFGLVATILIRSNRHKQKAYRILQEQKQQTDLQSEKTEKALSELKAVQTQLVHSEKMASLGEMAAGIAHEIQNPLNFVKNFSEVNAELMNEMQNNLKSGNGEKVFLLASDIQMNMEKISQHSDRADAIVKGMLQHSHGGKGQKESTDLNALVDQNLRLSYYAIRSKDKTFTCEIKKDFDSTLRNVNVVPQDIGRLFINLFNNAFFSLAEKYKKLGAEYKPRLDILTKAVGDKIRIHVRDNGMGIPDQIMDKIFQPFFTTKPPGQGTGLGLSLSYDIIKAHGGEITAKSNEGEGSEFVIEL
ncbi:MAG: ATP-binding protein [Chitinophagales bacterium]